MENNIKEVYIAFGESANIGHAIELGSYRRPSWVQDWAQRHQHLNLPELEGKSLSLFIHMKIDGAEQKIRFLFLEYRDPGADDYDPNDHPPHLADFTISLPSALSPKDWKFYCDAKNRDAGEVNTPAQLRDEWKAMDNFHDVLAEKLRKTLNKHGLIDLYEPDEQIEFERAIISMFLEFKRLDNNPRLIMQYLGL